MIESKSAVSTFFGFFKINYSKMASVVSGVTVTVNVNNNNNEVIPKQHFTWNKNPHR